MDRSVHRAPLVSRKMPDFIISLTLSMLAGFGFVFLLQKLPGRGLLLSHSTYCFLNKQHGFRWKSLL